MDIKTLAQIFLREKREGAPLDTLVCYRDGRYSFSEEGYAQFCARLDTEDAEQAAHEAKWAAIQAAEEEKQQPPIPTAPASVADLQAKWGKKR